MPAPTSPKYEPTTLPRCSARRCVRAPYSARDGAAALTLRRLAAASGTSTMAVYTLYGDKPGLLRAMYRAGFERLGAALRAASATSDDPLEALLALGHAYRDTALANPHLYDLMFGAAVPGFVPDEPGQAAADAAYQ